MVKRKLPLPRVVNVNDLLTLAKRRLPKAVFDYVDVVLKMRLRSVKIVKFKQVTFRPKQAV
jgi:hypothetical protein